MDIKKYKESGILEQYVLGLTSSEENILIEANLNQYPELQEEFDEIQYALEQYALSYKIKAPLDLKKSVLVQLRIADTKKPPVLKNTNTEFSTCRGSFLMGLLLLTGLVLLGWFRINSKDKVSDLDLKNAKFDQLVLDCNKQRVELKDLKNYLRIMRDPDTQMIAMKGTDKITDAIANVVYNRKTQTSYLDIVYLPPPPSGKQYQLWAIVDSKPVDMGVFNVSLDSDTNLQNIQFIEQPEAFAVTIEKKGGNTTPTLEDMVAKGNFTSG